jgi:hypothetical protein
MAASYFSLQLNTCGAQLIRHLLMAAISLLTIIVHIGVWVRLLLPSTIIVQSVYDLLDVLQIIRQTQETYYKFSAPS